MDLANFNIITHKPLVLVAPLDWGLGHTTRCIPLIKALLASGCEVVIACNSIQNNLLIAEFPFLRYVELNGYGIRYGKNRWLTFGWLLIQGVKILTKIKREHGWLEDFLTREKVDAVISDNRFGMYSARLPCIFITHQLQIKTGLGRWMDAFARRWNYKRLRRFSECWVPDAADIAHSLAGELSHPVKSPEVKVQYIGNLTRFNHSVTKGNKEVSGNTLLVILSGPEPQRSILESLVLKDMEAYAGQLILVRGLPKRATIPEMEEADSKYPLDLIPAHSQVLDHAPAAVLEKLIAEADWVISRCGYTSVMDLLLVGKKTILIPTPGQAEQEYLAKHLVKQGWAFTVPQKGFSLKKAVKEAAGFPYRKFVSSGNDHQYAVAALAARLRKE